MAGVNHIYSPEEQAEMVRFLQLLSGGKLTDTDDGYYKSRIFELLWGSICGLVYKKLQETFNDLFNRNREDMIDYTKCGLWEPILDYDPDLHYNDSNRLEFTTYISRWILHCGSEWVNENINQMTSHYGNIKKKYMAEVKRAEANGTAYNDQMISELIGESVTSIKKMKEKDLTGASAVHYDNTEGTDFFKDNASAQAANAIGQRIETPEEEFERREIEDNIRTQLGRLDPRRREAVKLKYGFYNNKDTSDTYIAEKLGLKGGAEEAKKLINSGLRDVKRFLNDDPLFEDRQISAEVEEIKKKIAFKDSITDNDLFAALEFMNDNDLDGISGKNRETSDNGETVNKGKKDKKDGKKK